MPTFLHKEGFVALYFALSTNFGQGSSDHFYSAVSARIRMKLYFYSLPKIVHNAPPPFLSNRKIPPTPLNSEIKFFSLKPGPSDPHISPLTS